jgi:hypothetical protein
MRSNHFVCLFLGLAITLSLSQSNPIPLINRSPKVASPINAPPAEPKTQAGILDSYGKLPLAFEANRGQTDTQVKFLSRTAAYSLFLTGDEAVLELRGNQVNANRTMAGTGRAPSSSGSKPGGVLRMKLRNANPAAKVSGLEELAGTTNYFIGNDPAKWRTQVPNYAKVKYEGVYSGIDLVYYGNQRQLEYDFIVASGADPRRIEFDISGAKRIRRDEHGDLVLKMKMGDDEIRWHKPVVYQEKDGTRHEIAARYAITDKNRVGFEVAKYDSSRPLYIDPLIYSTYLGGSSYDEGYGIAVDNAGNAYVTGFTGSTNFPTMNPLQPANSGGNDAFVAKINPAGSALVYSTYLGGGGGDIGTGIAVDGAGNAYVTGATDSTDFPTKNPLQAIYGGGGGDAFVAKLDPTGSALIYSTYLGGSAGDYGNGIALDSGGNAYIVGGTGSADFPTKNPLQATYGGGSGDAFLAKINAAGTALVYSTYLGGSGDDFGNAIAVDSTDHAYITGSTTGFFPIKNSLQVTYGGGSSDAFVAKITATGSGLVYSTYMGGKGQDQGNGIAVDSARNAYVTGETFSTDFPTTPGTFQTVCAFACVFVTKISAFNALTGLHLVYSTYLGGSESQSGNGIAVDSEGGAYVTGVTTSSNFPLKNALLSHNCNCYDVFVSKLNPPGSALLFSTYMGGGGWDQGNGIAVDSAGNACVTGFTAGNFFPINHRALQLTYGGGLFDAFVAKIDVRTPTVTTISSSLNPSTYGQAVTFTATVTSSMGAPPDGETVSFMKGTTVLGTGVLSGGSASFTTSALPVVVGIVNIIQAMYGGDSILAPSRSKRVKQVVNKATTTTTLYSSLNPSNFGQSVTFTATVTPQFSGTVNGSVTFYDGMTVLKTDVGLSAGMAKYTTSTLSSGSHTITATYNGNVNFDGSSASLTQKVN